MDGPYTVEVSGPCSGSFRFRALDNRVHEVATGSAPAVEFAVSLITQGREVLRACRQQSWWASDALTLESSLGFLEQECQRGAQAEPRTAELEAEPERLRRQRDP